MVFRFPGFWDFQVPFSDDVQTINVCTPNLQNPNGSHWWMVIVIVSDKVDHEPDLRAAVEKTLLMDGSILGSYPG